MGERGPPKKPTAMKRLEGNPGQYRLPTEDEEPQPEKIEYDLPPPDDLPPVARDEWIRLMPELRLCGLLTVADLSAFAVYCSSYARWVKAEKKLAALGEGSEVLMKSTGEFYVNPWVNVSNRAVELMAKYMREFGMTPSARARIGASIADNPPPRRRDDDGEALPVKPRVEAGGFAGLIGR